VAETNSCTHLPASRCYVTYFVLIEPGGRAVDAMLEQRFGA